MRLMLKALMKRLECLWALSIAKFGFFVIPAKTGTQRS
jgi:hypothetical protein